MIRASITLFAAIAILLIISVSYERTTESAPNSEDKVTRAGTAGRIAKWITSGSIGDSGITEDANGHIAIGAAPIQTAKFFVFGQIDQPNSAIVGNAAGTGRGLEGTSQSGIGVNGRGTVGVNGISASPNSAHAAVRGISQFGGAWAGDFWGDVRVTGVLTKGAGSFRIDHPLDPKNKYLSHSFVESPDMMNIYNGNIVTDANGNASIQLPSYFDALNRDFRYQLTVVGQFAQAMVSEKINGNSFKIKTDKPRVEVSWQVTGIREDKFAEEHRIKVETEKPAGERDGQLNP